MWEIDLCYIYGLNTCSPVQGNESDRIPLGRNEFSCSPYGYTDSGEEWEEALWKDKDRRETSQWKAKTRKWVDKNHIPMVRPSLFCVPQFPWEKGGGEKKRMHSSWACIGLHDSI